MDSEKERPRLSLLTLLCSIAILSLPTLEAHAGDWKQIDETEGIKVYSKNVEGSDLVAFMGKGVIDAPLEKVLWVLTDHEHFKEWTDLLYISRRLEKISSREYVMYQAYDLPLFISNRDYVYHATAELVPDTGGVILHMASVDHPEAPDTVGVRADLIGSAYTLEPIDENHSHLTVAIHTDPKGLIPTWLVNLIQRSWPAQTLLGVRNQMDKPHVKSRPIPTIED